MLTSNINYEVSTWDEYQDFSDTGIHGKLHDVSAPHADKPEGETILQEVSVAKTIQGKKARLQDCENICKRSVGPSICSPSLAKSISKPTSVKSINNALVGEIPFCIVEDKIDKGSEKEENNREGMSVCVNHRYRDE